MTLYEEEAIAFKIESKLSALRYKELKGCSRKLINEEGLQLYKEALTIPCLLTKESILMQDYGKLYKYAPINEAIKLYEEVMVEYQE